MLSHARLVICILVSAAVLGDATVAYKPTDLFFINCGSTSNTTDSQSQTWTSDQQQLLTSKLANVSFSSEASYQEEVPQVPYMTASIFLSNVNYSFPVSPGWKYLRLYFYPTRYESGFDAASSFFSVTVNGFTLLNNFSADLTVKASKSKSLIKEFIVPVNQTLNLTFKPSPSSLAFVNGVEIVSMPDRFYSKGGFDDKITSVGGSTIDFEINNWTSFETVHRLNIGGRMIDGVSDTGMFREWLAEEYLLSVNSGILPVFPGVKINYTENTPAYVAPEDVYTTYRIMGNVNNPRLNLNFNLTWLFPVDAGFLYLVRLHFCETLLEVNERGQRVFTIFIMNQIAKLEMDVIQLSGGSRIPIYLDFSVYVGSESGPRPDLRLDLHPYTVNFPMYYDAILNGVEILKVNSSEGSLAGPNPNPLVSFDQTPNHVKPSIRKGNSQVLVVGSSIVLAMLVAVIVLLYKKKKTKDFPLQTTSEPTDSCSPLTAYLCRRFSIFEIKYATNYFDEKLIVGAGGFGSVYKGRIDGGTTLVAVKRLGIASKQGAKEFKTELEMLSKLRRTLDQIIDPDLAVDITLISLEKFCEIAVRCVQARGTERPPMNDVVWGLEFTLQLHEAAKKNNEEGTMTDAEDLFRKTSGHGSRSTTTNVKYASVVGEEPKSL
ncbi:hypothetical protein Bca52824_027261 [Brassica carinata]|uniref:Malectin-like domain-containing protein n=1 Tax=Brassica carinata TaxID=52824 RepID=A0A8X7SJH8_BRACI|nr:hypothetical protein Bca52824_027261 [Brassica carinata]